MRDGTSCTIHRPTLPDLVLRLLGHRVRSLALSGDHIELAGAKPRALSLMELAGPPRHERAMGLATICLQLRDGSLIRAAGYRQRDAAGFVAAAIEARRQALTRTFDAVSSELSTLADVVERLATPRRYAAACLLQPFLERAQALIAHLPTPLPDDPLPAEIYRSYCNVARFMQTPMALREDAIIRFLATEQDEMRAFFDTIEARPLTLEQRRAVMTDEDATLVLAGAGSGKTSVIVAKTAYLIARGIRTPDEILLLAFGKSAAAEMAHRIKQKCGATVEARTFHALGFDIIRTVEGQGPALAPEASDDRQLRTLLHTILRDKLLAEPGPRELALRWFTEFHRTYKSAWDFATEAEYRQYMETHELRTLQGERVRSHEELIIANWLYVNGIAYDYEPPYEHSLPNSSQRGYRPDFRLQESGVYIEHFGVRKTPGPDGKVRLNTAPHIDCAAYLESMAWKRDLHRRYGTTLIETYSYENVEGHLLQSLEKKLVPYATPRPIPSAHLIEQLATSGQLEAFTQTLATFLRHFKSSGLNLAQCRAHAGTAADAPRQLAFLDLFALFLDAYERHLDGRIDFEDMIHRAIDHVRQGRYRSPYRHILVDEFQDISDGRAQLLLALKAQHADARLFAVGDDWQSIYRFAGSDIHLMRNFARVFGGTFAGRDGVHRTVDLGRTFRSVDKIAHAARRFVLQNPAQIEKQVEPAGTSDGPAIRLLCYRPAEAEQALRQALQDVQCRTAGAGRSSVLLLGRYQFVRPPNLATLQTDFPDLNIHFRTIHAAKGLEADHVIILRVTSGRMGLPSEIIDDSLLDMVLPEAEPFEHAEERRLFYVALTRARTNVIILADREAPSVFVRELAADPRYGIVALTE